MKRFALLAALLTTPAFATDIKPTFSTEQAQVILNLVQAEQKIAVATGNYSVLEQTTTVAKEILRAAQEAAKPPADGASK